MIKNIFAIVLTILCFGSVHQVRAQHGLEKIQERYKKFLEHVVIDVLEQKKDEENLHKKFFAEIHRDLIAWRVFWKVTVKDFCKQQQSCKLTEDAFYQKLCGDRSKFWLSQDLIDLGYVDDKGIVHPLVNEAFSSIAYTLRKLVVLTSGYFLPPDERIKKGLTGKHFDVNLEICIDAFEEVYKSLFDAIVDYILEDDFEEKTPNEMVKNFCNKFKNTRVCSKAKKIVL